MIFKWANKNNEWADVFSLNPTFRGIAEFAGNPKNNEEYPKLSSREMRFVMLVADTQSPCRMLGREKRRTTACTMLGMVDSEGTLTEDAVRLVAGENRFVERAIRKYRDMFCDSVEVEAQELLDAYRVQLSTIRSTLRYAHDNNLFADNQNDDLSALQIKMLDQANKIIKDGLDRRCVDAMALYRDTLDKYSVEIPPAIRELLARQKSQEEEKGSFDTANTDTFGDR